MISLFLISSLSILSVVGFGVGFSKYFDKTLSNEFGYCGLIGLIILGLYSSIKTFFFLNDTITNSIVLLIGVILFFLNKDFFKKKEKLFFLILFLLLFPSLLIGKPHDDFEYYHFGYSYYLNSYEQIPGIGNINHGFRTPSLIFYLNSLFYLPFYGFYSYNISAFLFLFFVNAIFLKYLFSFHNSKSNLFKNYYCLISIIFINIFFYRLGEHGTDKSAQILVLLFILELIFLINFKKNFKTNISKIFLILSLIISLKAFYILYTIFTLIIFVEIFKNYNFKTNKVFNFLTRNIFFYLLALSFIIVLTLNTFNTGCLLYPLNFTCIEFISWSIPKSEVIQMNNWYELWSKAGATPVFRVDNPIYYLSNFNWVQNWISTYFFNKVFDLIVGLTFVFVIMFLVFKKKKIINTKVKYNWIVIILFVLLLEWFLKHPALRYGGYCLIVSLIAIFQSKILCKFKISKSEFIKKTKYLVIFTFVVFLLRNIDRLNNEFNQYSYNPFLNAKYEISQNHFRVDKRIKELIKFKRRCASNETVCQKENIILKKFGKRIIIEKIR